MRKIDEHRMGRWSIGSILMLCVLLCACTEDSNDGQGERDLLQLTSYTRPYEEVMGTRAVPYGFVPFEDVYPVAHESSCSFGLFMVPEAPTKLQRITYREGGQWVSEVEVKEVPYYIYGFLPVEAVTSASIGYLDSSTDYSEGAKLTMNGLSTVSTSDICVIVGVQNASSADAEVDLRMGRFYYMGKPLGQNHVGILLDHLYAAVDLNLQVNETYHALRHIKLKRLSLKKTGVGSVDAVLTLRGNTTGINPLNSSSVTWVNHTGTSEATLFEKAEGQDLSPTPYLIHGFVAPDLSGGLSIESEYDVYDTQGNKVREGCIAVNYLGSKISAFLKSGQKSVLTLTINPTYLYQLSDPDLNNPTFTVSE